MAHYGGTNSELSQLLSNMIPSGGAKPKPIQQSQPQTQQVPSYSSGPAPQVDDEWSDYMMKMRLPQQPQRQPVAPPGYGQQMYPQGMQGMQGMYYQQGQSFVGGYPAPMPGFYGYQRAFPGALYMMPPHQQQMGGSQPYSDVDNEFGRMSMNDFEQPQAPLETPSVIQPQQTQSFAPQTVSQPSVISAPQQQSSPIPTAPAPAPNTVIEEEEVPVSVVAAAPSKKKKEKGRSWADVLTTAPPPAPVAPVVKKAPSKPQTVPTVTGTAPATTSSHPTPSTSTSVSTAPSTSQPTTQRQRQPFDSKTSYVAKGAAFRKRHARVLAALPHLADVEPDDFDSNPSAARLFVIKSYSEDDIHKCIKYGVWASTDSGNRRLNQAFAEADGAPVYLAFSVNASGQFCGLAQMATPVDFGKKLDVWMQDKWRGAFRVRWLFIKDVPNAQLRQITLPNNENKPVTNSRDTQEVPLPQAKQVLKILSSFAGKTSVLDDFEFYDKRAEEITEQKAAQRKLKEEKEAAEQEAGATQDE